jgi:hypothetical protein
MMTGRNGYAVTRWEKMKRKMPKRKRMMISTGLNSPRRPEREEQRTPKTQNQRKLELEY